MNGGVEITNTHVLCVILTLECFHPPKVNQVDNGEQPGTLVFSSTGRDAEGN